MGTLPKGATVSDLGQLLNKQTANFERSEGRVADLVAMAKACDARNQEVIKSLQKKKFLGIF